MRAIRSQSWACVVSSWLLLRAGSGLELWPLTAAEEVGSGLPLRSRAGPLKRVEVETAVPSRAAGEGKDGVIAEVVAGVGEVRVSVADLGVIQPQVAPRVAPEQAFP
jgi:hypothetical protein